MSIRSLVLFLLGCALGFGIAFAALRGDRVESSTLLVAPSGPYAPSDDEIGSRVTAILNGDDPVRRVTELGVLLSTLGPSAVPALVEAFEMAPLDDGDPEFVLFGTWWARFDPDAALAWTTAEWRARSAAVLAAVFRSWAHSDPERALATARGLSYHLHRDLAIDAAIAGWDESGRPGLLDVLGQLQDLDLQKLGESFARRRVVKLGPEAALRWVESLEATPRFQEVMTQRVASAAAASKNGAPLAAKWATPRVRSDDRLSHLPRRIATRWVAHDPEAAMAWLASLPAGADRQDGVAEAFRDWMRRDRQAASAWIEKAEIQSWISPALRIYTTAIAGERPEEAMELARRIGDPVLRDDTMAVIARIWSRTDRAAAEKWLARPGVPEGVRRAAAMAEAGNPARQRPRARAQRNATGGAAPD